MKKLTTALPPAFLKWIMALLPVVVSAIPAFSQRMIEGRVTSDSINALPNVTVEVKGSTISTLTDRNGHYTITAGDLSTLVFRKSGYTPVEEFVNGRVVIDVMLLKAPPAFALATEAIKESPVFLQSLTKQVFNIFPGKLLDKAGVIRNQFLRQQAFSFL